MNKPIPFVVKFNTYQKTAITTVGATIFLIFVGALVRATGSGLGCPDWPTCFGLWMPPTSASQLPAAYNPAEFNVYKTWTEYINRLVGVVLGFLTIATTILSWKYRKTTPSVFYSSVAALVLVIFNGWLGGRVVETELDVSLITIHMILAMLMMAVLLYAVFQSSTDRWQVSIPQKTRSYLLAIGGVLTLFTLIQLVIGTEMREAVDTIKYVTPRDKWISKIGAIGEIHRSFSWTIFLSGIGVLVLTFQQTASKLLNKLSVWIMGFIVFQIVVGVVLYYVGMPRSFQVLHLVGVAFLICFEIFYLLVLKQASPVAE